MRTQRNGPGDYTVTVGGKSFEVRNSGPRCWSFWPSGLSEARAMEAADACDTFREAKEAIATIVSRA